MDYQPPKLRLVSGVKYNPIKETCHKYLKKVISELAPLVLLELLVLGAIVYEMHQNSQESYNSLNPPFLNLEKIH